MTTKQAVYSAEFRLRKLLDDAYEAPLFEIYGNKIVLPSNERKFANVESVQAYCDAVLALNWVRNDFQRARIPVVVRERRGQKFAHYEPLRSTIAIPPYQGGKAWALRELVVCHELAHHLDVNSGHGPSFVKTYSKLLGNLIAPEVEWLYTIFCYEEGVPA